MRLTGQAALCGWTIDQEKEVLRDIFIIKMRFEDIQRELSIRPGATLEETLKSALLQEKGPKPPLVYKNKSGIRQYRAVSPIKGPFQPRVCVLTYKTLG